MNQKGPPPAGTNVDEIRTIALLSEPPVPSVSIRLGQGRVYLSRERLEKMAGQAGPVSRMWKKNREAVTEADRLLMIDGFRARELLEAVDSHADESGYLEDESRLPHETDFLVSNFLEQGNAAVECLETGAPVNQVLIHYSGVRSGPTSGTGHMMFSFDTGRQERFLFGIQWWVS